MRVNRLKLAAFGAMAFAWLAFAAPLRGEVPRPFLEKHCFQCHDASAPEAGLDLTGFKFEPASPENFAQWVRIHDRLESGEMPPPAESKVLPEERAAAVAALRASLVAAERPRLDHDSRTGVRRLTRAEYENTLRDLFEMPGILLQGGLPADGSAHGFDKNSQALDLSHVNLAKYIEAADFALDLAIATQPQPPTRRLQKVSLAKYVGHILGNGDGVLLRDKQPDPFFPPAGAQGHIDEGAHQQIGAFDRFSTVGLFRHEDESFHPYFQEFTTLYPGLYRVRLSLWSFHWDKGTVHPSRGTEAARLSYVQLTEDGRGGGHPSTVLGYFDAPSLEAEVHEFTTWMNYKETFGFNTASLAPTANYARPGRAMAFTGPGISCDWLEVDGPIHAIWPPASHRALFGDLPLEKFDPAAKPGVRPPVRKPLRQTVVHATNQPEPVDGIWTVASANPLADADRLLAAFLPRAFRRPVPEEVRRAYVARVEERLKAGDCFELAMRWAYRAALCSPDFLYHIEPSGKLDDHALACRLSYSFWNSMPDAPLTELARANRLHVPEILQREVERLLRDPKSQRFVEDFLGQWLKLRSIAANDADRKLYPEFNPYLQDSMVHETRAYFRELIDGDLDATHLVRSNFVMVNGRLATHYGIAGVSGSKIRRVELPPDCPRGGFLTQAAILKITANGTTTSPVPRGAFVLDRLLGQPQEPPPANVAAIEPDVRGATTIRDLLAKHRDHTACASCHRKMDPPGFALESFDVIGGFRTRYRSIGEGDPAPRGSIDPFIGISFKLGPPVDPSGVLPDGRAFKSVQELQRHLAADPLRLLRNMARQLAIYATGREVAFSDRDSLAEIVAKTQQQGGGLRTLLHVLVQSQLFQTK